MAYPFVKFHGDETVNRHLKVELEKNEIDPKRVAIGALAHCLSGHRRRDDHRLAATGAPSVFFPYSSFSAYDDGAGFLVAQCKRALKRSRDNWITSATCARET